MTVIFSKFLNFFPLTFLGGCVKGAVKRMVIGGDGTQGVVTELEKVCGNL